MQQVSKSGSGAVEQSHHHILTLTHLVPWHFASILLTGRTNAHTGSHCYCMMTACQRVPATGPFESDPLVIVRRKGLISHQIKCPLSFSVCFHSLFFPCSPLLLSSPPFSAVPRVTQVTTTIQLPPPLTMYCLAFPSPPLPLLSLFLPQAYSLTPALHYWTSRSS